MLSDDEWLSIADNILSAGMDGNWLGALEAFARATGSMSGELIGVAAGNLTPFHWVTGLGPDWAGEFLAMGGGDPSINPIMRAGLALSELQAVQSAEVIKDYEWRENQFLELNLTHYDLRHFHLTPLIKEERSLVGLAVLRSPTDGEITPEQRRVFTSLARHVRSAVQMQIALNDQGALLMANALDAMSVAAFICDRWGSVRAMTLSAETLVASGGYLRLKSRRLATPSPTETRVLDDAISAAAATHIRPGAPGARTLSMRPGTEPLVLNIFPLPTRENGLSFEPRVLITVGGLKAEPTRMKGLVKSLYGLTDAEADVALRVAEGWAPEQIAASRQTSLGTVRAQIREIYAKTGVRRQSELVSRMHQLQ